MIQLNPFIRR